MAAKITVIGRAGEFLLPEMNAIAWLEAGIYYPLHLREMVYGYSIRSLRFNIRSISVKKNSNKHRVLIAVIFEGGS